jgi:hypothetical protein
MRIIIAIMLLTGIGASLNNIGKHKLQQTIAARSTIETISNQVGVIQNIGTAQAPMYVIRHQQQYINLFAPNLPANFKTENKVVVFSGEMKAMHPMEDEFGQYFMLTQIKEASDVAGK